MSLPNIPEPDALRDPRTGYGLFYTVAQMKEYGQQCYEQALLDAMNKTLPFGKTGAVMAIVIGALKS